MALEKVLMTLFDPTRGDEVYGWSDVITSLPLVGVVGDDDCRVSLEARLRGDRRGEGVRIRISREDERVIANGDGRGETVDGATILEEEAT